MEKQREREICSNVYNRLVARLGRVLAFLNVSRTTNGSFSDGRKPFIHESLKKTASAAVYNEGMIF